VRNRPPVASPRVTVNMAGGVRMADLGSDPDGRIVQHVWSWGDGSAPTYGRTSFHRYQADGRYEVCVTDTDNAGSVASACITLDVVLPPSWLDTDLDGIPDTSDNCPDVANNDQLDSDGDGVGDACQDMMPVDPVDPAAPTAESKQRLDSDYDGVLDEFDNCPSVPNRDQADRDGDGVGDFCDADLDGDGIPQWGPPGTVLDNCPTISNPDQLDSNKNGIGDACENVVGAIGPGGVILGKSQVNEKAPTELESELFGKSPAFGIFAIAAGVALLALIGVGVTVWSVRRWKD
jgi:hypothetical protein